MFPFFSFIAGNVYCVFCLLIFCFLRKILTSKWIATSFNLDYSFGFEFKTSSEP